MKTEDAAKALAETTLFGMLDATALQPLAQRAVLRRYRRGQLIFYQGDPALSLFVLLEGSLKVYVTSDEGDTMLLVTLHPPDVVGEIALLDGEPRSASAEALVDSVALEVGREPFLQAIRDDPKIAEGCLRSLGAVLRRLTEQAADLVFLDLPGRVAKLILGRAEERGTVSGRGIELDLELTQGDLAAMVGASRQSVNQVLRSFEKKGYVRIEGKNVIIANAESLGRIAHV